MQTSDPTNSGTVRYRIVIEQRHTLPWLVSAQAYADICTALTKARIRFDGEIDNPTRVPWYRW